MRLGPHDVRRARLRRTPLVAVTLAGFANVLAAAVFPSLEPWIGSGRPSLLVLTAGAAAGAGATLIGARRAPAWSSADDVAWGVALAALSLLAGASSTPVGPGTLLYVAALLLLAVRDPGSALVGVVAMTAAMVPVVHMAMAPAGSVLAAAGSAALAMMAFGVAFAQTRRLARALAERDAVVFPQASAAPGARVAPAVAAASTSSGRARTRSASDDKTGSARGSAGDTGATDQTWDALVERLRSSVTLMAENAGVAAIVQAELKGLAPPSNKIRVHLLRIAQEATTQALRHADPRSITVRLRRGDGGVVFELEDDGEANDAVRERRSLATLRGRAAAVGGTAEIRRGTGGWVTRVRLPCEQLN